MQQFNEIILTVSLVSWSLKCVATKVKIYTLHLFEDYVCVCACVFVCVSMCVCKCLMHIMNTLSEITLKQHKDLSLFCIYLCHLNSLAVIGSKEIINHQRLNVGFKDLHVSVELLSIAHRLSPSPPSWLRPPHSMLGANHHEPPRSHGRRQGIGCPMVWGYQHLSSCLGRIHQYHPQQRS